MKRFLREEIVQWIEIAAGLLLCMTAYCAFLIPNQIAPGGFAGIGQLCNHLFGWNVGLVTLALNVPLFAFTFRSLGLRFGVRSIAASVGFSLLLDFCPLPAFTQNTTLSALFGGVIGGCGFGLILRGGATTGGSDMLAKLLSEHFPRLRMSMVLFLVDGIVILGSALVFDVTSALFALVSAFLMAKTLDMVLEGMSAAKAYFIISVHADEIAKQIMKEMERGVTGLNGIGYYSGEERRVLLCVVSRLETAQLRRIVMHTDSRAFMIATDADEAFGEGFKRLRG